MKASTVARLIAILLFSLLAACGGSGTVNSTVVSPAEGTNSVPVPGTFASWSVSNYYGSCGRGNACNYVPDANQAGDLFASNMGLGAWSGAPAVGRNADGSVTTTNVPYMANTSDILYFAGHGYMGNIILQNLNSWGVPNGLNNYHSAMQPCSGCYLTQVTQPLGSRVKWLVLLGSDTAPAPSSVESNPYFNADWTRAFSNTSYLDPNKTPGGSLRGIYGTWQSPGSCSIPDPSSPNRSCDLNDSQLKTLTSQFTLHAVNAQFPQSIQNIHDAFVQAASDANFYVGWSIWEWTNNRRDPLSGPHSGDSAPGGILQFYWVQPSTTGPASSITVPAVTVPLSAYDLTNESLDFDGGVSRAQAYLPDLAVNSDDGVRRTASGDGVSGDDFHTSGAVTFHGIIKDNAMAVSVADAQAAAQNWVQQSYGMPSDAVLSQILYMYRADVSNGSYVPTGYEFVWRHASGNVTGGDSIQVLVNDKRYTTKSCDEMTTPDPPQKPQCISWSWIVHDDSSIAYGSRLWRTLAARRYLMSNGSPSGSTSIDANTASLSLPPYTVITGYSSGYWTPLMTDSSSAGAVSAWLFTTADGATYAVDAASGQYLGTTY